MRMTSSPGSPSRPGHLSAPVLSDALAVIECEVTETVTGGTHRVFLARVVHAEAREGSPLAYFRGKFGRFELAEDAEVYAGLRAQVLDGVLAPDQTLDADQLARGRGVGPSAIHYALTRLVGEGLVLRTPDRGYVVTPIDAASSDEAHDARLVLDLGIADVWVGQLDPEQLETFRALALATIPQVIDGQLQVDDFVKANVDFHAFLPAVTGNAALQQAYERLSIADLMLRAFTTETSVSPRVAQDHLDLVEAYETADLARARAIIIGHHARAKKKHASPLRGPFQPHRPRHRSSDEFTFVHRHKMRLDVSTCLDVDQARAVFPLSQRSGGDENRTREGVRPNPLLQRVRWPIQAIKAFIHAR